VGCIWNRRHCLSASTSSSRALLVSDDECVSIATDFTVCVRAQFHRPGLTLQLANPRLRDNRGLSPGSVPSSSVKLTPQLTCDLTSFC